MSEWAKYFFFFKVSASMVLMKLSNILGDFFAYRNAEKEGIGLCKNYGQDFFRWKISAIASYYRLVLFCHSVPALLLRLFLQGFDRHQWFVAPFIYCWQKRSSSVLILLLIKTYTTVSASKSILNSRTDYGKVSRPTHLIVGMIHFHIAKSSFTDR